MANIKAYSVSDTSRSGTASTVYSFNRTFDVTTPATGSPGYHCGRNGAYDHPDDHGLVEGRTPTLVKQDQAVVDNDVIDFNANPAVNFARTGMEDTVVIATTRTVTGNGHGLIVRFDTTDNGSLPAFSTGSPITDGSTPAGNNFQIVAGGEGYADGDLVEFDGWPGSRVAVSID